MLCAILFSLFLSSFGQQAKVAIVNSTSIEDVKVNVLPEERSGSVMYVYARSGSVDITDPPVTSDDPKPQDVFELNNETSVTEIPESVNKTENNQQTVSSQKYCVVRVDEDETIKYYEGTMEEVRAMGKNVLDLLCEGDSGPELKVLSKGALASLVGG